MSRLDDLIAELCPDGVPYRAIGELCERSRGMSITAGRMKEIAKAGGAVRVFAAGNTVVDADLEDVPAKAVVSAPSVIVKSRGHIGFAFYDRPFTHKSEMWSYSDVSGRMDMKFLYYYLQTRIEELQSLARATSVKLPQLGVADTDRLVVPVPPLEVQREIVRILDHFTKLEAELEAELEARRAQFEFLREVMIREASSGAAAVPLGSSASVARGASPRPIEKFVTDDPNGVPWIKIGDVPALGMFVYDTKQRVTEEGARKSRRVGPGDFILSNSMSFGRPYISQIHGAIHDGWLAISDYSTTFVDKYLYHLLRTRSVQNEFKRRAGAGTVKNLNAEIVRAIELPAPPLDEQRHIADTLDKFDALVNDISIGLPAELEARRKQYAYYRDKLLTFRELAA